MEYGAGGHVNRSYDLIAGVAPRGSILLVAVLWAHGAGATALSGQEDGLAGAGRPEADPRRGDREANAITEDTDPFDLSTEITRLWLSGTGITEAGLAYLKGATSLRTLRLAHTEVTDDGLRTLAHLPSIQELQVNESRLTGFEIGSADDPQRRSLVRSSRLVPGRAAT